MVRKGLTSIEMHAYLHSYEMAKLFSLEKEWPDSHMYDLGMWENSKRMLGNDWYFWLIPTNPQLVEDGYSYKMNIEAVQNMRDFSQKLMMKRQETWNEARGGYVIPVK